MIRRNRAVRCEKGVPKPASETRDVRSKRVPRARATPGRYSIAFVMQRTEVREGWAEAERLLSVSEVMVVTGFGYAAILKLVHQGRLVPVLGKKPFRFDPKNVRDLFFSLRDGGISSSSSLKNQKGRSVGHKVTKGELWS